MKHVSIVAGHEGEVDVAAAAQARFDFDALLTTPIPGELPPRVGQFARVVRPEPERTRTPFGEWLLTQSGRRGWIGDLAKAAKGDRSFPKKGSPDQVRRRLQALGADGDAFEALDDAELDWASY